MIADTSKNYFILTLIVVLTYIAYSLVTIDVSHIFWDLNVYDRAVSDYIQGVDPYRRDVSLLFIYHPYVLKAFIFLHGLFSIKIWLLGFYFVATTFFVREFLYFSTTTQKISSIQKENISILLVLASLCFGEAGLIAVKTGNITIFLHFFIIVAFLSANRKSSTYGVVLFALLITLFSVIKPYFLAYVLLLPYLTRRYSIFYVVFLVCLFFFLIWFSGKYLMPELYFNFMSALHYQTLGKGDLGYAVFGLFVQKIGTFSGITFHSFIMLSYLLLIFVYSKAIGSDWRSSSFIPLMIIFIIFINPRMKVYDFPIAVLFSYLHLWLSGTSQLRASKVIFASIVLSSVPKLFTLLQALHALEANGILSNMRLFHIIGFMVIILGIISAAYEKWRSVKTL